MKPWQRWPDINMYSIKITNGISAENNINKFKKDPRVKCADPKYFYHFGDFPWLETRVNCLSDLSPQ
jgi:hypothetical protein